MIVNKGCGKLEIVQNIAKLFFQFVIEVKIYLLWACRLISVENLAGRFLISI
jgi:hypothetical protein